MNKENIVILTGINPYKGSGKVVLDLKKLLKANGHNVIVLTNVYLKSEFEDVISVKPLFTDLRNRIVKKIKSKIALDKYNIDENYYMYSKNSHLQKSKSDLILSNINFKPDAFVYIFPHDFLNEKDLYEINIRTAAPVFRYMADMSELTGGCHYAWDCEGYMKSCGNCPGLNSENSKDITYSNLKFKKKYIDKSEIYPIAASEWQMQQLSKSTLYKDIKKHKVLLPTDEKTFFRQDKNKARIALGLPLEKKIIFFGALNTLEKRKGANELLAALKFLNELLSAEKRNEIHLAIAGKADTTFTDQLLFSSSILGYLDYENLAKAYSAADVFVCPSIEDSGPTMINQSLMCGTPVVSFIMGVALDLIEDYKTGYKAELGNSLDLAKGMKHILMLSELEIEVIRNNCYLKATSLCDNNSFYTNLKQILYR